MRLCRICLTLATACLPMAGALAQDMRSPSDASAADGQMRDWRIVLGVGGLVRPDYEGSDDFTVSPLPLLSLNYRDTVIVQGPSLAVNAVSIFDRGLGRRLSIGPVVRYYAGRDQDDNDALRGLGDVDGGVEAGAFVGYDFGRLGTKLTVVEDLSDGHGGMRAEAQANYRMTFTQRLSGNIEAGVSWANDDYMQAYFGVSPQQSLRSGYAPRTAESGFKDISLAFGLSYALTDKWSLFGRLGYSRLLGDAADSPIVDGEGSANQFSGGLGISYRF